jgi:hypothetical protein
MSNKANRIKQFGLHVPTRDIKLRSEFKYQTRYITSSVEREFEPFKNNIGAWKVLVEVVPIITNPRIQNQIGVLTTQVVGDAENYLNLENVEKRTQAVTWLLEGTRKVFDAYGWPIETVESAIQRVIDKDFLNVSVWKKKINNKKSSASVEVIIQLDEKAAEIRALFRTKDDLIMQNVLIFSTLPSEFIYVPCLGKIAWLDERTVQLVSSDETQKWTATFSDLRETSIGAS